MENLDGKRVVVKHKGIKATVKGQLVDSNSTIVKIARDKGGSVIFAVEDLDYIKELKGSTAPVSKTVSTPVSKKEVTV